MILILKDRLGGYTMKKSQVLPISFSIIGLSLALTWKYPNNTPLGEILFKIFGISSWSNGTYGIYYVGIISFVFFIVGLIILSKRFSRKIIFLVIIISLFLPSFILKEYQTYFAKGVYALEYKKETSSCNYTTDDDNIFDGECNFTFVNYGNMEVVFYVSLDNIKYNEVINFLHDINAIDNYKLTIHPKETKIFSIPFQVDVSSLNHERYSGYSSGGINIMISDGVRERHL